MFHFVTADKVTDPESADRIFSKYKNREVSMTFDSQSFSGTLLNTDASEGTLHVEFTWKKQGRKLSEIEHLQKFMKSKIGQMCRFRVATDEFVGLLSGMTEFPAGGSLERYIDTPFMLTFAFGDGDQEVRTAEADSGIVGIDVPSNIAEQLGVDMDMKYAPHITVCYFPNLSKDTFEKVETIVKKAARSIGSFDVVVTESTTFPTPQDDKTYPHVALIKSQSLLDFHDDIVDQINLEYPGLVSLDFVHKNFKPHVTLRYVEDAGEKSPVKNVAWNVSEVTLNRGTAQKSTITLGKSKKEKTAESTPFTYFQLGETKIPVDVLEEKTDSMKLRLKDTSQIQTFENLEGAPLNFVSDVATAKMEILETTQEGVGVFNITFRLLETRIPTEASYKLAYVKAVAADRNLTSVVLKISKLLDFDVEDEDEDKEATGPNFPGTDHHIVTYVKAPQTQSSTEGPQFARGLPLHERI